MKCLVTGGAGFIGSHLTDILVGKGYEVTVLDDLSIGSLENISNLLEKGLINFVRGDILDDKILKELIPTVDVVYHLAALVGVKHVVDNPARGIYVNYSGTEKVMRTCLTHNKRMVFTSSSEVYGKSPGQFFKESGDMILGNSSVPRWSYAVSKALGEHLAMSLKKSGLEVTVVRYFNAYGPKSKPDGYGSVVAKFIMQALEEKPITIFGNGTQIRSFTFVRDTARGTMLAGESKRSIGKLYNLGSNSKIQIVDLAKAIKRLTGSKSPITFIKPEDIYGTNFEDIPSRSADVSLAKDELCFEGEIGFEEGLKKTIDWFKSVPLKRLS